MTVRRRWSKGLAAAFAGTLALSGPAPAGTLGDLAVEAEARLAADDITGALKAVRDMAGVLWSAAPAIGFDAALLVTEQAPLVGVYNPRPDNRFKAGEPILIYAEPWGFAYAPAGDGIFALKLAVDLTVLDSGGNVVGTMPDVTELALTSRVENREFPANIYYALDGITPGTYRLVTTLRDRNSARSGSFDIDIEIVP